MLTMQEAPDLGIPEIKPAIESIRGRWTGDRGEVNGEPYPDLFIDSEKLLERL